MQTHQAGLCIMRKTRNWKEMEWPAVSSMLLLLIYFEVKRVNESRTGSTQGEMHTSTMFNFMNGESPQACQTTRWKQHCF